MVWAVSAAEKEKAESTYCSAQEEEGRVKIGGEFEEKEVREEEEDQRLAFQEVILAEGGGEIR